MAQKPLKDVDSFEFSHRMRIALWSGVGAILFALGAGFKFGLPGVIGGAIGGWLIMYYGVLRLTQGAADAGGSIYMGDGASTPKKREYAIGDALMMQGKLEEAVDEYERNAVVYPDDPEPRLRAARMCRDRMQQYERAAGWFKQILAMPDLDVGYEIQSYRELAELYTHRLKQPERALPILARLADRHPDTTAGKWARNQMADIKQTMLEAQ